MGSRTLRRYTWRAILCGLVALGSSVGCATSSITFTDKLGHEVTLKQKIGGRGCIALDRDTEGNVEVIVNQDGSSDWAGIRALPIMAQVAITALMGNRSGESAGFAGPSNIGGCDPLFASAGQNDADDAEDQSAPSELRIKVVQPGDLER